MPGSKLIEALCCLNFRGNQTPADIGGFDAWGERFTQQAMAIGLLWTVAPPGRAKGTTSNECSRPTASHAWRTAL